MFGLPVQFLAKNLTPTPRSSTKIHHLLYTCEHSGAGGKIQYWCQQQCKSLTTVRTSEEIELFVHVEQLERTPSSVAALLGETIVDIALVLGRATHDSERSSLYSSGSNDRSCPDIVHVPASPAPPHTFKIPAIQKF